jgi:hypothetical protein
MSLYDTDIDFQFTIDYFLKKTDSLSPHLPKIIDWSDKVISLEDNLIALHFSKHFQQPQKPPPCLTILLRNMFACKKSAMSTKVHSHQNLPQKPVSMHKSEIFDQKIKPEKFFLSKAKFPKKIRKKFNENRY